VPDKSNSGTSQVNQEVAKVGEILAETKNKLLERGEKLSNLEDTTGKSYARTVNINLVANLRNKTSDFAEMAKRIRQSQDKKWYQL
jgi:molybdopterin converting factor small subunit